MSPQDYPGFSERVKFMLSECNVICIIATRAGLKVINFGRIPNLFFGAPKLVTKLLEAAALYNMEPTQTKFRGPSGIGNLDPYSVARTCFVLNNQRLTTLHLLKF